MNEKSVRNFKNRAQKGDVIAKLELYNYLLKEGNPEAEAIKKSLIETLNKNGLHLNDIQLYDFRKFKTLRVENGLDRNLTVIIGINGEGKTTVLEAIS